MLINEPSGRVRRPLGIGFLVSDITRRLRANFAGRLEGTGLTLAQARVLLHVAREPGLRQVDLAELLDVTPITLARLIDKLESRQLVERRGDAADGRAYRVFSTPAAADALSTIERISAALVREATQGIAAPDQAALTANLQRMRANLMGLSGTDPHPRGTAR